MGKYYSSYDRSLDDKLHFAAMAYNKSIESKVLSDKKRWGNVIQQLWLEWSRGRSNRVMLLNEDKPPTPTFE